MGADDRAGLLRDYASGAYTVRQLADKYGMSKSAVSRAVAGAKKSGTKPPGKRDKSGTKPAGQKAGQKRDKKDADGPKKTAKRPPTEREQQILAAFLDQGLTVSQIAEKMGTGTNRISEVLIRFGAQQRRRAIAEKSRAKYDAWLAEQQGEQMIRQAQKTQAWLDYLEDLKQQMMSMGAGAKMSEWKSLVDSVINMQKEQRVLLHFQTEQQRNAQAIARERLELEKRKLELLQNQRQEQTQVVPVNFVLQAPEGYEDVKLEDIIV